MNFANNDLIYIEIKYGKKPLIQREPIINKTRRVNQKTRRARKLERQ